MQLKKFKKTIAFLLSVIFMLSFSVMSFADEVTGETFFGYNTSLKSPENSENPYGIIMWGALGAVIFILVFLAVYNTIRLKKEEKERKAAEKPRLIVKKGYKN
ncbi:MAG: hypothetical protein E7564_04055 [Ruminococcaceae bacterium]|nr:hypothetical protein [Oscillospiraceae bacterium]